MTSYLNIKMKSDTHTGMKLETYDYHDPNRSKYWIDEYSEDI